MHPKPAFISAILVSLILGAIGALGMGPSYSWMALMISYSGFYWLLAQTQSPRSGFIQGWVFGFGFFVTSLSWIGNALLVEGNAYAWAWPLAVAGLPFLLSFFYGFASLAILKIANLRTISGFLTFTAIWIAFEIARSHLFTGFPWNLAAFVWTEDILLLQSAAAIGVFGLSWVTLIWASLGGFLLLKGIKSTEKLAAGGVASLLLLAALSYGALRLEALPARANDTIAVKIVQPNIPQSDKWSPQKELENFYKLVDLSAPLPQEEGQAGQTTLIIWPETAMTSWQLQKPYLSDALTGMLNAYAGDTKLITGILRRDENTSNFYNSIIQMDPSGTVTNIYDKSHLVPFGEYIPFQSWIPLEPVTRFKGFVEGAGPEIFPATETIKYSASICYEIIFSGRQKPHGRVRPDMIINVTNDAWYGDSAGPYQHLSQAVFRAVEEGVPVLRAANTGISAIISPTGSIVKMRPLMTQGIVSEKLPLAIYETNVLFFYNAKTTLLVMCAFILVITALGYIKARQS